MWRRRERGHKPDHETSFLRVLGKRTLTWLRRHLKQADERPKVVSHPPDLGAKKPESDAPRCEAQVCKLNPTPATNFTQP
jgi:hypothetical protein